MKSDAKPTIVVELDVDEVQYVLQALLELRESGFETLREAELVGTAGRKLTDALAAHLGLVRQARSEWPTSAW